MAGGRMLGDWLWAGIAETLIYIRYEAELLLEKMKNS